MNVFPPRFLVPHIAHAEYRGLRQTKTHVLGRFVVKPLDAMVCEDVLGALQGKTFKQVHSPSVSVRKKNGQFEFVVGVEKSYGKHVAAAAKNLRLLRRSIVSPVIVQGVLMDAINREIGE